MQVLDIENSPYNERITVFETNVLFGETGRFRCMKFADEAIQGAIDLNDTKRIVLSYQRALIRLMKLTNPEYKKTFLIGHGIGTIAGHDPDRRFKVAEVDEKVAALSLRHFDYRGDEVVIGDGREILKGENARVYDFVVLDAFNSKGTPYHLTTTEFFQMASDKLDSRGAILLNVMGKAHGDRSMEAIFTTLQRTFSNVRVFSLPEENPAEARNLIFVGSHRETGFRARNFVEATEVQLEHGHVRWDRVDYEQLARNREESRGR